MPIFNSQVLIKTSEKKNETKKTSPGINHRLKPYIESSYRSPQPASPPNSI